MKPPKQIQFHRNPSVQIDRVLPSKYPIRLGNFEIKHIWFLNLGTRGKSKKWTYLNNNQWLVSVK